MKKLFFAFTAAIALIFTSCSNDVSDSISTAAYPTLNLVTPADGSTPYITPSTYSFYFNISQGKAALTLNRMSFENTPYTFATDTLRYSSYTYQTGSGVGMLIRMGSGLTGYMNGDRNYPVKNINCDITGLFYWFSSAVPGYPAASWNAGDPSMVIMQYDAQDLFSVQTMQPESFYYGETTVFANGAQSYKGNVPVYRLKVNSDYKTADFIIYNAKYSDDTDQVRAIILEKIPFTFKRGGFSLKASNVVPKVYLGTDENPDLAENPDYKIDSFLFDTTNREMTEVSLDYEMAGKYSVTVAQMSYVIEKKD